MVEPVYASSTTTFDVSWRCSDVCHCCTYPEPRLRSTENTPWPRPASGVGESGATVGPLARTNAGVMLSSVRCETVCRNGKTGVVNGVVIPAISIQVSPYPPLTTILSVTRPDTPIRGPTLFLCRRLAGRGLP